MYAVQIERLRKEGSRLVAEEQEKLKQQLREEAAQLYNEPDVGVRLRVRLLYVWLSFWHFWLHSIAGNLSPH